MEIVTSMQVCKKVMSQRNWVCIVDMHSTLRACSATVANDTVTLDGRRRLKDERVIPNGRCKSHERSRIKNRWATTMWQGSIVGGYAEGVFSASTCAFAGESKLAVNYRGFP
jgi:hypothetical protein